MFKNLKFIALALIILTSINISAQNFNLDSKVPIDPSIKTGQLKNGLKYYIKKNKKPENRVEMRLAINAGSMQENDDQQGLAHFCEHMCFNGTKNFPKNELVNFLEKTGVKFGAHLNAYTSFDETVYMLQLPTGNKETLEKGFQVLADWGHNVSFDNEEIDKERGVVIEEWRLGLGASERMRQKWFPVLFKGSRYANRLPIGKLKILQNFKYQIIKDFYKDWYRPNLMAVVVVGDIDINETEKTIKQLFGKIPNPKNPRKREIYDIPDNKKPLISIATDKEATYNMVMLNYKHKKTDSSTVGAYKNKLAYDLYQGMINNRVEELKQKPDAPFIYANTGYGGFLGRTIDVYSSTVIAKENKILDALNVILSENEKVKRYGFTKTELDRQKKELLTQYEKRAKEAGKSQSRNLASEYISNFLEAEVIPGVNLENEYAKKFIPEISLKEVNSLAKKWITDKNITIVITAKEGSKVPTKKEVLNVLEKSKTKKYEAYVDKTDNSSLMINIPKPQKTVKIIENKKFNITELHFMNNVKVVIMPTKFKNDEILFAAQAPGGKSIASDDDIFAADYMTEVINMSGFGKFSKTDISKKLAGKTANIRLLSSPLKSEITGSASPKDFETLLKQNYQYFTDARKDKEVYKSFMSLLENQIKSLSASPEVYFYKNLIKIASSNNPRAYIVPTEEQLKSISLDKIFKYYNKAYKYANDYTFFIIGNIDVKKSVPLIEKYIGGIPTGRFKRNFVDRSTIFPEGITDVKLFKGSEPKSSVAIMMSGDIKWNTKNYMATKILEKGLSIKLRESMREEQGGVYGVRASISLKKLPKPEYAVSVMFGCSPANAEKLVQTVLDEMKKITENGITKVDIEKAKKTYINERESKLKENKFWIKYLKSTYFNSTSIQTLEEYKKLVNSITIEDTKKLSAIYFNFKNYVKVILKPEDK